MVGAAIMVAHLHDVRLIPCNVVVYESGQMDCMRWITRIVFVLVAVFAVLCGLTGFVLWRGARSQQAYCNTRPLIKSLNEANSRNGPDSVPARHAFLGQFPIGTDMGDVLSALAVDGFHCALTSRLEAAESQVRCSLQENPDLIIVFFPMMWILNLGFDKANKLDQVRVDQIPSAL